MKPIYVIIVTYNGIQWIKKCLDSVVKSTITAIPIIIDNGSTDGTLEFVKEHYPDSLIIETGSNLGFGKANNIGIQIAVDKEAEYVYLLNQDAWLEPETLETLVNIHKENQGYIILSPLQLSADGKSIDKSFYQNTIGQGRCPNLYNDCLCGNLKDIYSTTFVMAAHWLIYVPFLKIVGLFSPIFPHYGEDTNFVHRATWFKYKIGICPSLRAYHDRQYRIDPPEKWLHKEKTSLLAVQNNPMLTYKFRLERYTRYVYRILRHDGLPIIEKIKAIYWGMKISPISKKYRKIYITENCYDNFKVKI